jgi:hypothetical protein
MEEQLVACVQRCRQLLVELIAEKNRLSTCVEWMKKSIEVHVIWLEEHINRLAADVQVFIIQNSE